MFFNLIGFCRWNFRSCNFWPVRTIRRSGFRFRSEDSGGFRKVRISISAWWRPRPPRPSAGGRRRMEWRNCFDGFSETGKWVNRWSNDWRNELVNKWKEWTSLKCFKRMNNWSKEWIIKWISGKMHKWIN